MHTSRRWPRAIMIRDTSMPSAPTGVGGRGRPCMTQCEYVAIMIRVTSTPPALACLRVWARVRVGPTVVGANGCLRASVWAAGGRMVRDTGVLV